MKPIVFCLAIINSFGSSKGKGEGVSSEMQIWSWQFHLNYSWVLESYSWEDLSANRAKLDFLCIRLTRFLALRFIFTEHNFLIAKACATIFIEKFLKGNKVN